MYDESTNQPTQNTDLDEHLEMSSTDDKQYNITLSLSTNDISNILDFRLGEKMDQGEEDIDTYLNIAECIKSSELSDAFCKYFTNELRLSLKQLISYDTDSYEISNFQHRMLRKFANCRSTKKQAWFHSITTLVYNASLTLRATLWISHSTAKHINSTIMPQ